MFLKILVTFLKVLRARTYCRNFVQMLLARALKRDWEEKQALFFEATVVRPSPIGLYFVSLRERYVTCLLYTSMYQYQIVLIKFNY